MEVKLVVANGKQTGKEIPIKGPHFLIGRGEGCQLRPQSSEVSRKHCDIVVEKGAAAIEDCGSTNGTFLNDHRITGRQELKDGDRLRVGVLALEVRVIAGAAAEKKPKGAQRSGGGRSHGRFTARRRRRPRHQWLARRREQREHSGSLPNARASAGDQRHACRQESG